MSDRPGESPGKRVILFWFEIMEKKVLEGFERPRVVMSKCLELEACRYDGQKIPSSFVRHVLPYIEVRPVCPEVEIGLGTPRDTIRLVDDDGETRLMQPETGRDLTEKMEAFARNFRDKIGNIDGIIFKNGSPTCGPSNVKVYGGMEKAPPVRKQPGLFARQMLEDYGDLAVEDEGRLRNYPIRHHFLTQLYSFADLRAVKDEGTVKALADFQRRYKHLLLVYDEQTMRRLGRLAANPEDKSFGELIGEYERLFREALSEPPERQTYINALEHMYGHFKDEVTDGERQQFFDLLDEYRAHQLPLFGVLSVMRTWVARYDYDYFKDQALLQPYPRELVRMRDSGKGIDF